MFESTCAVVCRHSDLRASKALSEELNLELVKDPRLDIPFFLEYTDRGLSLNTTSEQNFNPVVVDFVTGKSAHRRNQSELIVKATAIGKKAEPNVLDATAGLGGDSFILALHGAHVTMLERNPIVAALLSDGIERASLDPSTSDIAQRMNLIRYDSEVWMQTNQNSFDCIYLDPMFPVKRKKSAVKKEMQIFQSLVSPNNNDDKLLENALENPTRRCVVKRPLKAGYLENKAPNHSVKGRSTRFDVYLKTSNQ